MSISDILSALLIGPLKLVFEIIYMVANRFIGHPGLSIIVLSLIMNLLVLPLYRRADAMQEASRDVDAKLRDGVTHIKKTFQGDERMMILQAYYRQNHYKPTDALNGSVSLLLEIPFFMAAYQFLSALPILDGASLGPIKDLGSPDALLVLGSLSLNALPILMTLINVISSAIYLKGFPLKTKVQLYGMALFFLVFLYDSPAGLVFYWTLNNLFSLVKTIFYKLKNPSRAIRLLSSAAGALLIVFSAAIYTSGSAKLRAALMILGVIMQLPLLASMMHLNIHAKHKTAQPNSKAFFLGSLLLCILIGILIPSTYIAASAQEYVDITHFYHPLWYVFNSFCLAAGTFLIWMRVFYWLASDEGKVLFDRLIFVLCGVALINYMFFGTNLGIISANLQYEKDLVFSSVEQLINIAVLAAAALALYCIFSKWGRAMATVLLTGVVALGGMSAVNVYQIIGPVTAAYQQSLLLGDQLPGITLSKSGQNVVVLMLDRALGYLVPFIFNEKPELREQFSGFTYYDNVISYGMSTNFGVPPVYGGYEYTPVEMNRRNTANLVDKHNEALKVMPVAFQNEGFKVTVCDPPYANYRYIPDLSIFGDYPEIETHITKGVFSAPNQKEESIANTRRNFFCFSLMKSMPLFMQGFMYNDGWYNRSTVSLSEKTNWTQIRSGLSRADGMDKDFLDAYYVLTHLPAITELSENRTNTFLILSNETSHAPAYLSAPDYAPSSRVDNTQYDAEHSDRFAVDGKTLAMTREDHVMHYHINAATFIQLGHWFDHLKEIGVYDNTRIILVSDHGTALDQMDELTPGGSIDHAVIVERYFPLLMVKDFGSTEFTTSNEFMTNADVPALAMKGLIDNPVNPFTGKSISSSEKTEHDQYILLSNIWDIDKNNGTTFLPSAWASVRDDIWNPDNWTVLEKETVLTEHAFD